MQLQRTEWRGPTPEELEVVRRVQKETGILTVKDNSTGHPAAKPYGQQYDPAANSKRLRYGGWSSEEPRNAPGQGEGGNVFTTAGASAYSEDEFHVRTVKIDDLIGSKRLPKGVAIGGVEVYRRDVPLALGGSDFSPVAWRPDICTAEMDRLRSWANERVWVTDEMYEEAEKTAAKRREMRDVSQQDPVGVIAAALEKLTKAQPQTTVDPATLSDEEFEKEAVRRRMAKARAARGQAKAEETVAQ